MTKSLVSADLRKLRPGTASRPRRLRPDSYCPRSFLWRRIVPVSGRPRNVIPSVWTEVHVHRRLPSQCEQSGRSLCRARRREEADLRAEKPARSVSVPSAGSHRLNGLPVHRSIVVAGRRGHANGGEPAVRIGDKTEWSAFMMASWSRRGGCHLIPSRVIIKGHTGTLRARAGYVLDVAAPACRRRGPSNGQAGSASCRMPLSGLVGGAPGNAAPAPATALPGSAGVWACLGGPAVVQRSVHDLASLQYQRMSAHARPPSGTSRASGSAMPHMAHSATSSGRRFRCAAACGPASAR